ncbi:MAG: CBS domain-containing protein [Anaerolineaceae bacterium]|jgi:CBS domain-containing protein|nr:CBS domain-containing protein [Anaerolineaceae bacterium]OQY87428.1 MAG: histidine kinase [Anaerolineae bacterium UTCFX1]
MPTVRDMIRKKGSQIYSISPTSSALEAMKLMAQHNLGAVLVVEEGVVKGILSERDCVRKLDLEGKTAKNALVKEIMTARVVSIEADEELEACMMLMIERNIRHLPVYADGNLMGILSVRDVLREVVEAQRSMIAQLEHYITGGSR